MTYEWKLRLYHIISKTELYRFAPKRIVKRKSFVFEIFAVTFNSVLVIVIQQIDFDGFTEALSHIILGFVCIYIILNYIYRFKCILRLYKKNFTRRCSEVINTLQK